MDYPRLIRNIAIITVIAIATYLILGLAHNSTTYAFPKSFFSVFGVFMAREWILLHPRRFNFFERLIISLSLIAPLTLIGYIIMPISSYDWVSAILVGLIFSGLTALLVKQPDSLGE